MDYRTTLDLSSTEKQLILASQEMLSFYCIYAKITPLQTSSNNEYKITFELKNYKGPIKFKIKKIKEYSTISKYKIFQIFTTVTSNTENDKTVKITLKKDDYFICHRISENQDDIGGFLVSEESFSNIENLRGKNETHYEIEKKLVEERLEKLKKGEESFAASDTFCVLGISKFV